VSISLVILIFVIFPLRQAGLAGRFFFDIVMVTLMVSGAFTVKQNRILTVVIIAIVIVGTFVLWISRFYPSLFLVSLSSIFSVFTALLYARIVLLVMFRQGPVTWS